MLSDYTQTFEKNILPLLCAERLHYDLWSNEESGRSIRAVMDESVTKVKNVIEDAEPDTRVVEQLHPPPCPIALKLWREFIDRHPEGLEGNPTDPAICDDPALIEYRKHIATCTECGN